MLDRFALYTLAVQDPPAAARFLEAVHGGSPRILREDFSGAAAIAVAWTGLHSRARAIAVDLDPVALAHADPEAPPRRFMPRVADARTAPDRADVIAALNFPLGYFHERRALIAYLRRSRDRLRPRGVFVADMYGGPSAFRPGRTRRPLRLPGGGRGTYIWHQRTADPLTGIVENSIHFRVPAGRGKSTLIRDAFTYRWRLWGAAELREAMLEAGFRRVEAYDRLADAIDGEGNVYVRPLDGSEEARRPDDNWMMYFVGRTAD